VENQRPVPPAEPYRLFFPIGIAYAIAGAALWPLLALGQINYPGLLHGPLMIQGFEMCFIIGFLLTIVPRFTGTSPRHPVELILALGAVIGFGAFAIAGMKTTAQLFFLLGMMVLLMATGYRLLRRKANPPEEFFLVALGLGFGYVGGLILLLTSLGVGGEPTPGYGLRLISLGMVLTLVLGVGGILVPGFLGIRENVIMPRFGERGERLGRRGLYIIFGSFLVLAFVAEAAGHEALGFWIRSLTVSAILLFVWRIYRVPRKRDLPAFLLWSASWGVLLGLWIATLLSPLEIAGFHVTLIAGFGVMTMTVATRISVVHGGGAVEEERLVLSPEVAAAMGIAVLTNLIAHISPAGYVVWLGASGAFWAVAWVFWSAKTLPRMLRRRGNPVAGGPR
jgi:uncharacterized protein involved in response to NO